MNAEDLPWWAWAGGLVLLAATGLLLVALMVAFFWAALVRPIEVVQVERPRRGRPRRAMEEEVEVEMDDPSGRAVLFPRGPPVALTGTVPVTVAPCPEHPGQFVSRFQGGGQHLGCEDCEGEARGRSASEAPAA